MVQVLVCVKRVPDTSGEVLLTEDGQAVDARYVGWTMSPHEECAVELATQVASATDGTATVATVGTGDAEEQLRSALAVGCTAARLVEAEPDRMGPTDVAAALAEVVRDGGHDLFLLGNDAADTGDFQVGVRLAYALGWPVVTGISTCEVVDGPEGGTVVARGDGPDGTEVYELPLPAVVTVLEGGVAPRYPSIPGRMKAKKATIERTAWDGQPAGNGRVRLKLPPAQPSQVEILGEGPEAAPAVVDLLSRIGVLSR